jgi:hypothetical protein
MARPRKTLPASDPFVDLARKTEILEREMDAQRAAIERLKQIGRLRPRSARLDEMPQLDSARRRQAR